MSPQERPFQASSPTYLISASVTGVLGTQILGANNSLNATGPIQYQIYNSGTVGAWVAMATDSNVVASVPGVGAPSNSIWVGPGVTRVVTEAANAYISAITQSGSATLFVTAGTGAASGVADSGGVVSQGTAGSTASPWPVLPIVNGQPAGTAVNPVNVTGTLAASVATLNILSGLSATNYNLNSAAYSGTSSIGGPYKLNCIKLHFSTNASKTIVVTDTTTGTVLAASTPTQETATDFVVPVGGLGFPSGHQFTVAISQTTVACAVTFSAEIETGQIPMGGNPVVDGFVVDNNNSYSGSLAANATTPTSATDVSGYSQITANVYFTPGVSAGATYTFRFSPDGSNWYTSVPTPIPNGDLVIPIPLRVGVWKYFNHFVTNGSTPIVCQLQANLHHTDPGTLTRTGNQTVQPADPVVLTRALIEPSFKGHLNILGADRAIGGEAIVMPYIIQDVWQFDAPLANNNIGVVQNGGATAVQSPANGVVMTLPDAATASNAQLQGQKKNRYKPGREFRKEFSFGFPSSGVAGANCLAGLCDSIIPAATNDGPSVTYTATTIVDTNANFTATGSGVTVGQTVKAGVGFTSTATITSVAATTITMSGGWTGGTPTNYTPYFVNPKFVDPTTTGNGIYLGWVGTTFGMHFVSGGTITSYAQGTWASTAVRSLIGGGDTLDGSGLSDFRQNGGPVAWVLSSGNAFRIRGVWFGVGPVYLDIKSPDDRWVPAFKFLYPNTTTVPYIQNPNLFLCTTMSKSAVSTSNYHCFKFCCNVGTVEAAIGFEPHEINGHTQIQRNGSMLTGNQLMHTVNPGRQYLLSSLSFSSTAGGGSNQSIQLFDGTKLVYSFQPATNNNYSNTSENFTVPLIFYNNVNVVIVGSLTYSANISGYEKEF